MDSAGLYHHVLSDVLVLNDASVETAALASPASTLGLVLLKLWLLWFGEVLNERKELEQPLCRAECAEIIGFSVGLRFFALGLLKVRKA